MNSKDRAIIKKIAANMHPMVSLGIQGLDHRVVNALREELRLKEIVKLRFQAFKEEKEELSRELALQSRSELVSVIGNIAIYYKDSDQHLYKKQLSNL